VILTQTTENFHFQLVQNTPMPGQRVVELPCEVVGFFDVGGRKTVKVLAEKRLNNAEYQDFVARSCAAEKQLEMERKSVVDVDARTKERLKRIIAEKSTLKFNVLSYVDLDTGLSLRKELTTTFCVPVDARKNQTQFTVTQLLNS
jgi:hypothetical protein